MKMRIIAIETQPGSGGIGQTSQGAMTSDQADMSFYFESGCYIGVLVIEKSRGNLAATRKPKPYIVPAGVLRRVSFEPEEPLVKAQEVPARAK
jgi:hypothetical protein